MMYKCNVQMIILIIGVIYLLIDFVGLILDISGSGATLNLTSVSMVTFDSYSAANVVWMFWSSKFVVLHVTLSGLE